MQKNTEFQDTNNPGLRLLALDGGGIKGMSELLTLRRLMEKIKLTANLSSEPRPCDYFDMIAGSGGGGLIALMLGRLSLTVTEAIKEYRFFNEQMLSRGKKCFGKGKFKATVFEEVVKQIIKRHSTSSDRLRLVDRRVEQNGCKTFVLADSTFKGDTCPRPPSLLRTYSCPHDIASGDFEIWEAAQATCAVAGFLKPIVISARGLEQDYIGGRVGFNNPCTRLILEASEVFNRRPIACLINIGNGLPFECDWRQVFYSRRPFPTGLFCPFVDNVQEPPAMAGIFEERYFRFNVPRDLVDLSRWYQDEAVRTVVDTNAYLDREDVQQALDRAVKVMIGTRPLGDM